MTTQRQPRRTGQQWQVIVDSYQASGLSAPQFCRDENINYVSFAKWKKRLSHDTLTDGGQPAFIELTQEHAGLQQTRWHIEVDLAPGVQLRIAR